MLNHPKFGDLVKQLQGLKAVIRDWNRNVFGNAETQIKKADDVLYNLDLCLENRELNADEKTLKNCVEAKTFYGDKKLE